MVSAQTEEYLEAIRRLEERSEPATTSALARDLGVSAPSVTEMVRRLVDLGYVTRQQRGEIHLTEPGRTLGTTVVRRHRLWERFLTDVLGLPWERVHSEACRLEHATSPETEARLELALGATLTCPHGNAIPGRDGATRRDLTVPLSENSPGDTATVASLDESEEVLSFADRHGLHPGARLTGIVRRADGTMTATVGNREAEITPEIQAAIRVYSASVETPTLNDVSLADVPSNRYATVRRLARGGALAARCLALGFTPGTRVQMVQNIGRGPIIVTVRDTRVALGRGEARAIAVSPAE
jgi:DtxR family transcriptional regulator, Mn-dependent transcriptional regulator